MSEAVKLLPAEKLTRSAPSFGRFDYAWILTLDFGPDFDVNQTRTFVLFREASHRPERVYFYSFIWPTVALRLHCVVLSDRS